MLVWVVVAVAVVLTLIYMVRPAPREQLGLVTRLPMDGCLPVAEEEWRNGTALNHRLSDLERALKRHMEAGQYGGLSTSHLGVPTCMMAVQGWDGTPMIMINARLRGTSSRRSRVKERSSLCPNNQTPYAKRYEWITVQYRRATDWEEMYLELSGDQSYIVQHLLDAQNGINACS